MTDSPNHVVYLSAPSDKTIGLTATAPVVIELTTENRASMRSEDGSSPLDFLDLPSAQIDKYGRLVVRRATVEEVAQ